MHIKNRSNHPAIITEERSITYHELYTSIHGMQQHLLATFGKEKQRKIGIALGNSEAFIEVFFAVTMLGWIAIPFDSKWSQYERTLVEQECQPDAVISGKCSLYPCKFETAPYSLEWHTDDEFLFYIGYTSGSTGKPKGFMRNHRSWVSSFQSVEKVFQLSKDDTFYVPGPLCHSLSLFAAVHAIHLGATLYVTKTFEPERVIRLVESEPISAMYVVPTMIHSIATVLSKKDKQLTNALTIISSGAKCTPELKDQLKKQLPYSSLIEFYGASELSFITYLSNEDGQKKPSSVGKPFPGVEIYLVDENQRNVSVGEIGTLCVKSPFVFSGYVNEPMATKDVFRGDVATVGDLAYQDEEGFITLVGREKNMIISGGLNIYPEEVEAVIQQVDEVDEVVVMSESDPYWGEKLVAILKWKDGRNVSIDALKTHCRSELSSFKCPRSFIEVKEFPYTSSGKIARKEVQQLIRGEKSCEKQ
nr:AMP-binding protein [Metabacillus iocasae]